MSFCPPARDCPLCPRLVAYRLANQAKEPTWHNAPVPSFGKLSARLLVVGQAPGVNGANKTGRPFTGDDAGNVLYNALLKFGFASGDYAAAPDDGLILKDCRITNAVRCAPPQHKLKTPELKQCNQFLRAEISAMKNLRVILAVGRLAHELTLQSLKIPLQSFAFGHGKFHAIRPDIVLADSYHTSRYNVNTKRLTVEMFELLIAQISKIIEAPN